MKTCTKCAIEKVLSEFHRRGDNKQLYRSHCMSCTNKSNCVRNSKYRNPKQKLTPEQKRQNRLDSYKRCNAKRKAYNAAREAKRRACKLQATPIWLDETQKECIDINYYLARYLSDLWQIDMEVDHIVPLQGKNVSGLHVPWNLQIMVKEANRQKNNSYSYGESNGF